MRTRVSITQILGNRILYRKLVRLLVNLIRVTWLRTRMQYAVLKISIESCLVVCPYGVCRVPWGRCLCSFVRWSTEHDTDRETQARRSSCYSSSCTPVIIARGVFAWFPAGYGKSSCYQLLAFVYDFKLKWTRSRETLLVLFLVLTK